MRAKQEVIKSRLDASVETFKLSRTHLKRACGVLVDSVIPLFLLSIQSGVPVAVDDQSLAIVQNYK